MTLANLTNIPSSVYRIQFDERFTLKRAKELLPYLFELGIEGIYGSPLFDAASSNGYDVVNPHRLNPAIGTLEDYEEFLAELNRFQMKQLLDVVPNHMGIKSSRNLWWQDVLLKGRSSPYAAYFDIEWDPPREDLRGKIVLPILAESYGKMLQEGKIGLLFEEGRFVVRYEEYLLPVAQETAPHPRELPLSMEALHGLLEKQVYRLCHWHVAGQEVNYRRFFNINELVAIHIEKEQVFKDHHSWIFHLAKTGRVQGLRIDHPDGLYDPTQYFTRLKAETGCFLLAEKILDTKESLPKDWPVEGSVGYDFVSLLTSLFIDQRQERRFEQIYTRFVEQEVDFERLLYERKSYFMRFNMGSEVQMLGWRLRKLAAQNLFTRDFTQTDLTRAIKEVIACYPVYRTYFAPGEEVRKRDHDVLIKAILMAQNKVPEIDPSIFDYLRKQLLAGEGEESADFVRRFQQLTGPVMAKGLEDSCFYLYNRFIGLNEVGSNPSHFGLSKAEFHSYNIEKRAKWPLGLLASSTHDTKFSEDVRYRLAALSEFPTEWAALVQRWKRENCALKTKVGALLVPDLNMEYYLYQLLVGISPTFPLERLLNVLTKIVREAGVYTDWRSPQRGYEEGVRRFVEELLAPKKSNGFLLALRAFQERLAPSAERNRFSALALKMGSCGIVDIYQGNEGEHEALVDPDNRLPVDRRGYKEDRKFLFTQRALCFRRSHKALFLQGDYLPLKVYGRRKENAIAFLRKEGEEMAIVIASLYSSKVEPEGWSDTAVRLPKEVKAHAVKDLFSERVFSLKKSKGGALLPLVDHLREFPCSILIPHV